MKTTLIIFILFSAIFLQAEIQPDKAVHFSGCVAGYILADCVAEWLDLPSYAPFLVIGSLAIGKELNDPFFNWKDVYADGAGIFVGFGIRFCDRRQR